MKKSDIERQLKKDLDDSAPSDFDALRKKCAISDFEAAKEPVSRIRARYRRRRQYGRREKKRYALWRG